MSSQQQDKFKKLSPSEQNLERMIAYQKSPFAKSLTPEVQKMNGVFTGTLTHALGNKKDQVDDVLMEFHLEMVNGKLSGDAKIVLTNPEGEVYSNSTGSGENNYLKLIKGNPNKIYVEPAPGDFIIMDISNPKILSGEYYENNGSYKGLVKVWRKRVCCSHAELRR